MEFWHDRYAGDTRHAVSPQEGQEGCVKSSKHRGEGSALSVETEGPNSCWRAKESELWEYRELGAVGMMGEKYGQCIPMG